MSSENEKRRSDVVANPRKYSIWPKVAVLSLILVAFALFHQISMGSKNAKIDLLQQHLDDCRTQCNALEVRLDSLKLLARSDSALICPGAGEVFLDGGIVVVFKGPDPGGYPDFEILEVATGSKSFFTADLEGWLSEFKYKNEMYVLYFLGLKKEEQEDCARVRVGKMR